MAKEKMMMSKKQMKEHMGMGFKAAQMNIAKNYAGDMNKAGAILASATRNASPSAKKKNPNLKKVKG